MGKKLKVIGLALMAVCAFGAISASAAQAAHWTVGGAALSGTEKVAEKVELTPTEGGEAVLTVPSFLRITCTGLNIVGGVITSPASDSAEHLKFTGCAVLSSAGAATKCTVKNTGGTIGTIETPGNTSALTEVSSTVYDVFSPPAGSPFVTLVIEAAAGGSCALSGNYEVTGKAVLKLASGTNNAQLEGEASETIQKAVSGAVLKFGAREAFLDGKGDLKLASGKTWGTALK